MPWTQDAQGVITKSADSDRDAWTAREPMPAQGGSKSIGAKPADNLSFFCFGSWDARSCYEVYIDATNITIRKVSFCPMVTLAGAGNIPTVTSGNPHTLTVANDFSVGDMVDIVDSDCTPPINGAYVLTGATAGTITYTATTTVTVAGANAKIYKSVPVTAPAAHSLPAATPYTIELRITNLKIEVFLNGATSAIATYTLAANDSLVDYRAFGFLSKTASAAVNSFQQVELVPAVTVRERMLWWLCGGRLYVSLGGTGAREVARGVCKEDGFVPLIEHRNKLYICDGSKSREVNPIDFTVSPWTASPGNLPGFTTAGTSDMVLLVNHWGRVMGVSQSDPANIYASRLNSAADWDTAADSSGRAFTFVTARVSLSGSVIRTLISGNANRLTIGCASSIWQLMGDPSQGQVVLDQRSATVGMTGPTSAIEADSDVVLFHSPTGFYRMVGGEPPSSVSEQVLTQYLQFTPGDRSLWNVHLARDTTRKGVLICMVKEGETQNVHFWYDERIGGYDPSAGGFFPLKFPTGKQPTASVFFDGKLLIGCEDGYIRYASDTATSDDGTAIESYACLGQINAPGLENDTVLRRFYPVLGKNSAAVTVRMWRGQTSEMALSPTDRSQAWQASFTFGKPACTFPARAPCLVPELYAASGRWILKAAEYEATLAQLTTHHNWTPAAAPDPVCSFPGGLGGTGGAGGADEDTLDDGPGPQGPGIGGGGGDTTAVISAGTRVVDEVVEW